MSEAYFAGDGQQSLPSQGYPEPAAPAATSTGGMPRLTLDTNGRFVQKVYPTAPFRYGSPVVGLLLTVLIAVVGGFILQHPISNGQSVAAYPGGIVAEGRVVSTDHTGKALFALIQFTLSNGQSVTFPADAVGARPSVGEQVQVSYLPGAQQPRWVEKATAEPSSAEPLFFGIAAVIGLWCLFCIVTGRKVVFGRNFRYTA